MSTDTTCLFQLVLKCTSTNVTSTETVQLKSFPEKLLDLKEHIQDVFSIPLCTQIIQHESTMLNDSDSLKLLRIRSGDTLKVFYEAKADCAEVEKVVTWLQTLLSSFDCHLPSTADASPSESEKELTRAVQEGFLESFRRGLFVQSEVREMNKLYFLYTGGIELLLKIYSLLLKQDWSKCLPFTKFFELSIINVLYSLCINFELRNILIKRGCTELCIQSLLRLKLIRGIRVRAPDAILPDVVASAVGTLCNMCEVPEAHMKMASNPEVLEQFISIAHSPTFTCSRGQLAMNAFVGMAHNAEVHYYMATPSVIAGVIDTCGVQRVIGSDSLDILLLQYFVQLFLAQLTLVSPQLLPPSLYDKIHTHMSTFLKTTTATVVSKREQENGFFWCIFLPFLKLLYVPTPSFVPGSGCDPDQVSLPSLWLLGVESAIFGLQCMLANDKCREGLLKEGLIDYFVCVPGHVPSRLMEKARILVASLGTHVQLQPPSLGILARAKLAKMHFGLEKMIRIRSIHEVFLE